MFKDVQYPESWCCAVPNILTTSYIQPKMKVQHPLSVLSLFSASLVCAKPPPKPQPPTHPPANSNLKSKCAKLATQLRIENGTVQSVDYVTAGTNLTLPNYDATCAQAPIVVTTDFCRVAMSVSTSSRSGFRMEAWLPSNWTGRFLSVG